MDGQIHNGAHFPLCVFTSNARARSAEKAAQRARRKGHGAKGKSMRSATGIGKSKAKNEFGELPPPEFCVLPDTPGQHSWDPHTQPSQGPWGQPVGRPPPPPQSRHNWQQSPPQSRHNWHNWSSWDNSWDGRWWSWNAQTGWGNSWDGW